MKILGIIALVLLQIYVIIFTKNDDKSCSDDKDKIKYLLPRIVFSLLGSAIIATYLAY